jgi:hypothetical protein
MLPNTKKAIDKVALYVQWMYTADPKTMAKFINEHPLSHETHCREAVRVIRAWARIPKGTRAVIMKSILKREDRK